MAAAERRPLEVQVRGARREVELRGGRPAGAPSPPLIESRSYERLGRYVVQAAIASLHLEEPRAWPETAGLYAELVRMTGSAITELNRAIAVAEVDGVEAGRAVVDRLDLDGYHCFDSTRADLLPRLGRGDEARTDYARALELGHSEPESSRGASQKSAPSHRWSPEVCPLTRVPFVVLTTRNGRKPGTEERRC